MPKNRKSVVGRDAVVDEVVARGKRHRTSLASARDAERPVAERNDLRPSLQLIDVPLSALKESTSRTRRTTPALAGKLERSLRRFGLSMPIGIDDDNTVIVGHGVLAAARRIGLTSLSCVRISHLSPTEKRLFAIAMNRTAEIGEWDVEALSDAFWDFADEGLDLADTMFEDTAIDALLAEPEADSEPKVLDVPTFTTTRPGDVWLLEEHRVGCFDARDAGQLAQLLEGAKARAAFIDPPYNVPIAGFVSSKAHREFVMAVGEMSTEVFRDFLAAGFAALKAHLLPGAVIFACMDWRSDHVLRAAGEAAGLELINKCVWAKPNGGQGSLYRSGHEMVLVFKVPGADICNNIQLARTGRYRTNVWNYPGGSSLGSEVREGLDSHSTPKNPDMVRDAIEDVTRRGDLVLDSFLGGGTTLIASERAGRRFAGGDLDPTYVDVSVLRWMRATGRQAVLAATGETFEMVHARRAEEKGDRHIDPGTGADEVDDGMPQSMSGDARGTGEEGRS